MEPCKQADYEKYYSLDIKERVDVDNMLLLEPPLEESSKNILNILNDDCLYEVFKRIHPSSYYLIADVCLQFNRMITEMLAKKYKENIFDINDFEFFTLPEADHYLRYFGSFIYQARVNEFELKRSSWFKMKIILKMISKHCVNLHYFHIVNFGLEKLDVDEMIPLFTRLTDLIIRKTDGYNVTTNGPVFLPSINCPKLINFQWLDTSIHIKSESEHARVLGKFLQHNPQLEIFRFFDEPYYGNKNNTRHLPMNVAAFGPLNSLKTLLIANHIHKKRLLDSKRTYIQVQKKLLESLGTKKFIESKQTYCQVTNLIRELSMKNLPIEYFYLRNVLVEDIGFDYVCQMKTLKRFFFRDFNYHLHRSPIRDVIESKIIRFESNLPNLELLIFQTSVCLDLIFTDGLVNQVQEILQREIVSEIKLNIHHFNTDAFTDIYNLTTIQNTYRKYANEKEFRDYRLRMRKVRRTVFLVFYIKYLFKSMFSSFC